MLLLAACLTAETFTEREYRVACRQQRSCDADGFDADYESVDACVERWLDTYASLDGCRVTNCTFDDDQARQCLADLGAADCASFADGSAWADCGDAWAACDETEYNDCLAN